MAIIKCPECGQEISDKALKCINCGFVMEREKIENSLIASDKPVSMESEGDKTICSELAKENETIGGKTVDATPVDNGNKENVSIQIRQNVTNGEASKKRPVVPIIIGVVLVIWIMVLTVLLIKSQKDNAALLSSMNEQIKELSSEKVNMVATDEATDLVTEEETTNVELPVSDEDGEKIDEVAETGLSEEVDLEGEAEEIGSAEDVLDVEDKAELPSGTLTKIKTVDMPDGVELNAYVHKNYGYKYNTLIVKNNWQSCDMMIAAAYYDKKGTLVDMAEVTIEAFEKGTTRMISPTFDNDFDSVEYTFTSRDTYYHYVTTGLKMTYNVIDNKIVGTVKNTGDIDAAFVQVRAIFFKGDEVVGIASSYAVDDSSKIMAGKEENFKMNCANEYDRLEVYVYGR